MKRTIVFAAMVAAAITLAFQPKTVAVTAQEATDVPIPAQARLIDSYFAARHMPLAGKGSEFASAAEKNGIDWRLLPAIAVRESSGGLQACGANVFGWTSCKRGFRTVDEAIETVAANLGGNVTSTRPFYEGKGTTQILLAYNPPSIMPGYAAQVEAIMDAIGKK